jgi:hypothetical protein
MSITVKPPDMDGIIRKSGKSAEEVAAFLELVKRSMEPFQKRIAVVEGGNQPVLCCGKEGYRCAADGIREVLAVQFRHR